MENLNNITIFGKFRKDKTLDYTSDKVLVNYEDGKNLHIVDGINEVLKNLLINRNLIKENDVITQEKLNEAIELGYIKVVDIEELDHNFYKNIVEREGRDELTLEETEEIKRNVRSLELKQNERESSRLDDDFEEIDLSRDNQTDNEESNANREQIRRILREEGYFDEEKEDVVEKDSEKDSEKAAEEDVEEMKDEEQENSSKIIPIDDYYDDDEEEYEEEADEEKRLIAAGRIGVGAGLLAAGAALGLGAKHLIDANAKPNTQNAKNLQDEITTVSENEQKAMDESISSVNQEYENNNNNTNNNANNNPVTNTVEEDFSSDVVINDSVKKEIKSNFEILNFDLSNATEVQKDFLNSTAGLITKFHEQTHKSNNFRLENDNEHYLDLTLDEAMSLNLLLNDYTQDEINQIFGSHQFNSEKIQNSAKSAYTKLATYYMNATEKSGLSDIIKDEKKKELFDKMEDSVLRFNQNATVENAIEVHRQAYYNYITSGASNEYANDDLTAFFATSPLMGFVMTNSTTSYQVENFLISRLNDSEELNKYGEAYLRSGTHFVALAKEGNNYVVQELDAFGNCINRAESETTIMSLINDKALLKSMIRKSDNLGQMVANANEKYLADELAKDQKIIESRKFVEYILSGNNDYRYALFNALGANFDNYNEFLKECFATDNVREAELLLSSLSMNVSIDGLNSHLGKLGEVEISEISQTEKGKNVIAIYNKLISRIETKTLTLNQVANKIDFSKLGGIYGINDNQAVGYLVNVRRDILTKQFLNLKTSSNSECSSNSNSEKRSSSNSSSNSSSTKTTSSSNSNSQDNSNQKVVERRVETTEREEVSTKEETHTERKEVTKEELTEKERKQAERKEKRLEASNFVYNIAARASQDVNEYMNSNEYKSDSTTTTYVNKYNDQDLNNESLINQARLIRAWNDGSLSEISTSNSQIIAKKNEDAQNFIDSLSDDEIDLLKSRYGNDWKSETKALYKKTWSNDLKEAFSKYVNTIGKGEYLRKYKVEEDKLRKENQSSQSGENQVVVPEEQNNNNNQNNNQSSSQTQTGENSVVTDETQDLGQGSKVITDVEELQGQTNNTETNQNVTPSEQNNNNNQSNEEVVNEILPDESLNLGQGEQPVQPNTTVENEVAPIVEENNQSVERQNTNQNEGSEITRIDNRAIQPEEIPEIDETTDANEIEPVSLENKEAKGKVLTRRI